MKNKIHILASVAFILLGSLHPAMADLSSEALSPDPQRLVELEGANNFRDLGGYQTVDGRTVRWGLIYRSDALGELTAEDLETLAERDLRTVVDFRSSIERENHPDILPGSIRNAYHFQVGATAVDPDQFRADLFSGNLEGADFREMLIDGNRQMVDEGRVPYGELLGLLAEPENAPLVFHCAGGKDRTGVGAALLLSILGVPRETIIEDYLLTNFYRQEEDAENLKRMMSVLPELAEGIAEARQARREYILAAFDEIDTKYGGVDSYVRHVLGLSEEQIESLRDTYLE